MAITKRRAETSDSSGKASDIIVWNPATGKFRKIPPFGDSRGSNNGIFYGFSSNVNGYELIRIDYESVRVKANSFSLGTDTWRDIQVKMGRLDTYSDPTSFAKPPRCTWSIPVLRNGVFYWEGYGIKKEHVLYFDVCNEVFDVMWLLDDICKYEWELRELIEDPVVVVYSGPREIDLWMLNENEKSWTMKHKIDIDRGAVFSYWNHFKVLGFASNSELVLKFSYDEEFLKLFMYNMDTGDASILPCINVGWICHIYLYTESLVSVNPSDNVMEAGPDMA